ncbi:MAG TPA: HPP family protein [Rhodocyclaceae bacterium]|jgi:CBS domain-containing membrane protein|nr:HPP family protein [Rhodocyclaceae bacterium]
MPVISKEWLRSFLPARSTVDRFERMRSCVGALFGIALTGAISYLCIGDAGATAWLVAPMGASAVLLFAVPSSPLAQPWSIIGGNLASALIGVTCAKLFGAPLIAAAIAISLAIGAMFILRCIHPPSGAVALTMVLGGPAIHAAGYSFVFVPVMLNSILLAGLAIFYNNAIGRRYPHAQQPAPAPQPSAKAAEAPVRTTLGIAAADLDAVLKNYNQVLDISREDLENIFMQVEMQAYRRRFGEMVCQDVMRTDVISVDFGTSLEEAWRLLHTHKLKALPVLDRGKRVVGIVTPIDFMEHAGVETYVGFKGKLRHLLSRSGQTHSTKPEVVGQIMTTNVRLAEGNKPIIELLPLISEHGLRHIPVVDDERRLIGMLTQADMVNALYGQKMAAAA